MTKWNFQKREDKLRKQLAEAKDARMQANFWSQEDRDYWNDRVEELEYKLGIR